MLPVREISDRIQKGEVIVLPTDTIYGLSCSVHNFAAADRIFKLKDRARRSPFVTLIGSIEQLESLGVSPTSKEKEVMKKYWPGPLTIEFETADESLRHYRGVDTVAVRLPKHPELIAILLSAGPIISTSANISGLPPASTIEQAKSYFGDAVDAYYDEGLLAGEASTIIRVKDQEIELLRQGRLHVP